MAKADPQNVAALGKILSHPLRIEILEGLGESATSPKKFFQRHGAPLANASYHFNTLKKLGFVDLVETIPCRGAVEHVYSLSKSGQAPANSAHRP